MPSEALPTQSEIPAVTASAPATAVPILHTSLDSTGYNHIVGHNDSKLLTTSQRYLSSRKVMGLIAKSAKGKVIKSLPTLMPREYVVDNHRELMKLLKIRGYTGKAGEPKPLILPDYDSIPNHRNRTIAAVGFEVEGMWRERGNRLPFHVVGDGSVTDDSGGRGYNTARDRETSHEFGTTGEVRCGPYENGIIDLEQIQSIYPDYVNKTCGLHVHISTINDGLYSALMCGEFYHWFINGLKHWRQQRESAGDPKYDTFWHRIKGRNTYCKVSYNPDNAKGQAGHGGSRYNAVNYCHAKHGTVEFRVLNAYHTAEECVAAVKEVTRLVQLWLEQFNVPETLFESSGDVPTIDGIPNPVKLINTSDGDRVMIVNPSLLINRYALQSNCNFCAGNGWRLDDYHCGVCYEWCSYCQNDRYSDQLDYHNSSTCWANSGFRWSSYNLANGIPMSLAMSTAIAKLLKPCPGCGISYNGEPYHDNCFVIADVRRGDWKAHVVGRTD